MVLRTTDFHLQNSFHQGLRESAEISPYPDQVPLGELPVQLGNRFVSNLTNTDTLKFQLESQGLGALAKGIIRSALLLGGVRAGLVNLLGEIGEEAGQSVISSKNRTEGESWLNYALEVREGLYVEGLRFLLNSGLRRFRLKGIIQNRGFQMVVVSGLSLFAEQLSTWTGSQTQATEFTLTNLLFRITDGQAMSLRARALHKVGVRPTEWMEKGERGVLKLSAVAGLTQPREPKRLKVNIVGAGSAGLYLAILLKQQNPDHEITLFERNSRDSTFGWGVVFNDRTFEYLQKNDAPTAQAIAACFQAWDNVDVVHQGQKVTIRGNKFSGIARIELLNILQGRCEELGVKLHFETNVSDPRALAECDLLVGADGVASVVKKAYGEFFQPSLAVTPNRYIWYGTPQLFHGLTLMFRSNDDGLFIAHAYKFSGGLSTFIVECDPQSRANAGFDSLPEEEARAYLEAVFRDDLSGQPLLSNRSRWTDFGVVTNQRWHHQNVVLLGDALHTVHFSIGSGTKLALEDAIVLAESIKTHGGDVPAALKAFEGTRRPIVEGYQQASDESRSWFEGAGSRMGLDPYAFAFSVMTRSGRVDVESLRRRDSRFVDEYERSRPRQT